LDPTDEKADAASCGVKQSEIYARVSAETNGLSQWPE